MATRTAPVAPANVALGAGTEDLLALAAQPADLRRQAIAELLGAALDHAADTPHDVTAVVTPSGA